MKNKKLKPLPAQVTGCLNCGYRSAKFSMQHKFYDYGFDFEYITKNNKEIFSTINLKKSCTMQKFENTARKEPNADWRFHYMGGMADTHYQRQGKNNWVLIAIGRGMA